VSQSDRWESQTASSISRNRPRLTRSSGHTEQPSVFARFWSFSLFGSCGFTVVGLRLLELSLRRAAQDVTHALHLQVRQGSTSRSGEIGWTPASLSQRRDDDRVVSRRSADCLQADGSELLWRRPCVRVVLRTLPSDRVVVFLFQHLSSRPMKPSTSRSLLRLS